MTLIEAVLRSTGCTEVSELASVPKDRRRQLAAALSKIAAEKAPLEQWNTLLTAFGAKPAQTRENARDRLIRILAGTPSSGTAGSPRGTTDRVPEKTAVAHKPKPAPRKKSAILRIWNVFTTLLVAVAALLAVALSGVRLIGLQVFTVQSESMEPVYHVGSLIYVKTVDPAELAVGDDITFLLDEDTVETYRIVGIVPDENDPSVLRFRTQGVANEQGNGSLVHCRNVIGKPVFTIPYLGYIADYIQDPPGTYAAIAVCAVVILLVFLPDLFSIGRNKKSGRNPQKTKKDNA